LYFTEFSSGKIGSLFYGASSPLETAITLPPDNNVAPLPFAIVEGPDGNMWFTDFDTAAIGRFSVSNSSIVEYATPTLGASPYDITAGTDGALWFTELFQNQIGRITTSGTITEYPICNGPQGIAVRSNGVVWVACASGNALARLVY
jgi:virginiamycin B lyase